MIHKETLDFMLREISKVHTNKINKVLEGIGLHKGQPMMLTVLYRKDGVPQSYLAKELAIKPATASTTVKRLEKGGYVIRKRDAEDERVSNVYLTDKGRDLSSQLNGYQNQMNDLLFKGFSEDEKADLRNYFDRILDNLAD